MSQHTLEKRDANMELLRVLSMCMVLVLHALLQSGALDRETGGYYIYWTFEALCICAVNLFVLISGYFQVESKFKSRNILKIGIGGVWIYSVVFSFLQILVKDQPVGKMELVKACFPLLTKKFWFVNSYLALYILSPYLNKLLHRLSKKQLTALSLTFVVLFSIRTTFLPLTWGQDANAGMGILWFITLYCVASWLRICRVEPEKPLKYWLIYLTATAVLVASKFVLDKVGVESYSSKLFGYSSIVVLVQSVALFKAFLHSKPIDGRVGAVICFAAKHSFSVYIIHFAMWEVLFTKILHIDLWIDNMFSGIAAVLIATVTIFAFCIGVDFVKSVCSNLMGKLLRRTRIANRYGALMDKWDSVVNE